MCGEFYGIFDYILELEPELIKLLNPAYQYTEREITKGVLEQFERFRTALFLKYTAFNQGIKDVFESQALLPDYYFNKIVDERLIKAWNRSTYPSTSIDYLLPLRSIKNYIHLN